LFFATSFTQMANKNPPFVVLSPVVVRLNLHPITDSVGK